MLETVIVVGLLLIALFYTETIKTKRFLNEEDGLFLDFKERDYNILMALKYGENVDYNKSFMKRIKTAFYSFLIFLVFMVGNISFLNLLMLLALTYFVYKSPYMQLKTFQKSHMKKIDLMLPYYLKNLEILCQNYTVPVALSRSIEEAPQVFKQGLRELVAKIDAGDSSIQPYMDFALQYPVRDSMRMMRLLYRLGLGAQENKYKQLLLFSKSVSALQNKARENKYKQRLETMEKKTMIMLGVTGGGTMLILLLSMLMFFGI